MSSRAHFQKPVQDALGNLLPGGQVTVSTPVGSPLTVPLYTTRSGGGTHGNPYTSTDGIIDFYLNDPQFVQIAYEVPGLDPYTFDSVPVFAPDYYSAYIPFSNLGPIAPGPINLPFYVEDSMRIESIRASVWEGPVGGDLIVDVKINGVSVFSDPGDMPTITDALVGSPLTSVVYPTDAIIIAGDYVTAEVAATGISSPGSNLVLTVFARTTYID